MDRFLHFAGLAALLVLAFLVLRRLLSPKPLLGPALVIPFRPDAGDGNQAGGS